MKRSSLQIYQVSTHAEVTKDVNLQAVDYKQEHQYDGKQRSNQGPGNGGHEDAARGHQADHNNVSGRAQDQPATGERMPEAIALAHEIDIALAGEDQHEENERLELPKR